MLSHPVGTYLHMYLPTYIYELFQIKCLLLLSQEINPLSERLTYIDIQKFHHDYVSHLYLRAVIKLPHL